MNVGLVLTGGGARAAYQAGVLRAIAEARPEGPCPFSAIAGVSAGSLNGAFLAAGAGDFRAVTQRMWDVWANVRTEEVFDTRAVALAKLSLSWIRNLSLGGLFRDPEVNYLLDTAPLKDFVRRHLNEEDVYRNLTSGLIHGLAISATNYVTGTGVTFFDGRESIQPWYRTTRIAIRTRLTSEHVLASCALPFFFPPVKVEGSFYGDGCIRFNTPLSPAIHMGADRLLAIGIRHFRTVERTLELNRIPAADSPTVADITGVLLNAVFLDSLETDLERMERINRTVQLLHRGAAPDAIFELRNIPVLPIRPSRDLGSLAAELFDRFPLALRHLLKGIGASGRTGWDLLSYLAFDGAYTRRLLNLGYEDAQTHKDELISFLNATGSPALATD